MCSMINTLKACTQKSGRKWNYRRTNGTIFCLFMDLQNLEAMPICYANIMQCSKCEFGEYMHSDLHSLLICPRCASVWGCCIVTCSYCNGTHRCQRKWNPSCARGTDREQQFLHKKKNLILFMWYKKEGKVHHTHCSENTGSLCLNRASDRENANDISHTFSV